MYRLFAVLLSLVLVPGLAAQNLVDVTAPELAVLPTPVNQPLLGVVGDDLVVLGGWTDEPDSSTWSQESYYYDDGSWQPIAGIDNLVRAGAATAVVGNGLAIVGGRNGDEWSPSVAVIRRSGSEFSAAPVSDLPIALHRPSAIANGQKLTVAGFVSDQSGEIRIFSANSDAADARWDSMPSVSVSGPGEIHLALQNEGLFVAVDLDTGGEPELVRHTDIDGWMERSGPGEPVDISAGISMGQAHIGFLVPGDSPDGVGGQRVLAYSTITDEWADAGHLEDVGDETVTLADGETVIFASGADNAPLSVARVEFEVGKRPFFWLDYFMVGAYLTCMILIGFYFSRREKGTEDFFVGGRRMPWWAVGFSLYATGTSAISFMAIPAKSYATDWLYLAQNAIGTLAIIPVALFIVPLIRRLRITSTYEFLEMRFHVIIRLMGSVLAIVYQLGARMSVVLFLPALALSAVTGVGVTTSILFMGLIATLYTVLGGIKAVIWTDVVQVVVLLGGALLCLVIIIFSVDGGLGGLLSVASADSKMHMFDWRLDLTIPTVWLFMILATADTITWPRDQVMVQRVLSTKSAKEAGWSVWTLGLIVIPGSVLFFALGTALYGFYKLNPEKLSPLLNLDATFPFFIAAELPAGVAGLIIAALFAASMSTLDSSMNSVSTIVVVDFYKRFKKSVTDKAALRLAKWITVLTGVFGTAFALVLSRYSLPSLWDTFIMLTGLLGGGFGGVYALGMFTRRANWQGALVGIVCSIFVTLAVRQYTDIHLLLYFSVAIISCIVIGYFVSLFFPMQEGHLEGLTVYMKDNPDGRA